MIRAKSKNRYTSTRNSPFREIALKSSNDIQRNFSLKEWYNNFETKRQSLLILEPWLEPSRGSFYIL